MKSKNRILPSDEATAIKRMNYLRGFFAILIVLGHCSMQFEKEILPLFIIHKFNMVSVGFFFAISGWSLSYNCNNKKDYLKGFFINKVVKLFLFALISVIISEFLSFLFLREKIIISPSLLLSFNWYIYEMIIFYIMFYVAFRIKWKRFIRVGFVWLFSIVFCIAILCISGRLSWFVPSWYFSSLCFALGITIHEYYDSIKKLVNAKILCSIVFLALGLASCICLKMPQNSLLGGVILHNAVCIFVMITMAVWVHFIDFSKVPVLAQLTKLSTEIYLYQFVVLNIADGLFKQRGYKINILYVCVVLAGTIVLSVLMHFINIAISKALFLLSKQPKEIRS